MPLKSLMPGIALSFLLMLSGCDRSADAARTNGGVSAPMQTRTAGETIVVPAAHYVGKQVCARCHGVEEKAWRGSHHDLAMQLPSEQSVLGNFNRTRFVYNNITSTFYRDGAAFKVRTDGPDGKLHDYTVKYTFGVYPLQQYLIELDGGKIQALGIAWDSRPAQAGGQRWFHLYPHQKVDFKSPLHWTARNQNWNYMCAECHSTHLQKNYDFDSDSYKTAFSDIDVACESCHGPGSNHVAWANGKAPWVADAKADKGLVVRFDERADVHWQIDPATGNATRSKPRATQKEIDTCARCHSRRSELSEQFVPGQPIGDTHRVSLLDRALYFADGQPADEDYVYGSFLQSKMYHEGVTCSDCHDPHSLALKLPGDQVCSQCHSPGKYATTRHHFHPEQSAGARCANCHMPVKTFMVIDGRHDHSFRIPRPDLSVKLGTPNVCTHCHDRKTDRWAAETVAKWYGHNPSGFQQYATTLAAARDGDPAVRDDLLQLVGNSNQPAIARATAVSLLPTFTDRSSFGAVTEMTTNGDPLLRRAAAEALDNLAPSARQPWLTPLLDDKVLDVRIATARALAAVDSQQLDSATRSRLETVLDEYIAVQRLNADRPEAWVNLGSLYADRRDIAAAEHAYQSALQLDADYVPALVNLADLYRATGREEEGETLLRNSLKRLPDAAALHHSLGLLLIRQHDYRHAVTELERAAKLAPDNSRFAYVYAVAQNGVGQIKPALTTLEGNVKRHPFDRDSLAALVLYAQQSGDEVLAQKYAARLQAFDKSP